MNDLRRLRHILDQINESRIDRYISMFDIFSVFDNKWISYDNRGFTERMVKKVAQVLRRDDIIVWLLRCHRLTFLSHLLERESTKPEIKNQISKRISLEVNKANKWRSAHGLPDKDAYALGLNEPFVSVTGALRQLEHYFSLNIQEINQTVFQYQTVSEIIDRFIEIENKWKAKTLNRVDQSRDFEEGAEVVIEFPDGWQWVSLNRPRCNREGSAMGHCGNASGHLDDNILSLREPKKSPYWRPHCTFILHRGGFLGEMKGVANQKPDEKYRPHIIELLKLPIIKGIDKSRSMYLPENNFDIESLSDKELKDIKKSNPKFKIIYPIKYPKEEYRYDGREPYEDQ